MSETAKRTGTVVLALAALLLAPRLLPAWGANGHRIVGQGAQDALSDEARHALREIAGAKSLALLANWPDFIRAEPGWKFAQDWHYMTVEDGQALAKVLEMSGRTLEPDNLIEAIGYFAAILDGDADRRRNFEELMRSKGVTPREGSVELTALCFLVHFVGDLHQPLHVGRGGDHGGNSIAVNFFGEIQKLHSVWDSGMIEREGLSYSEFARFLEAELAGEVDPGDGGPEDWARESIDYRLQLYEIWGRTSRDNYLPELGYDYVYEHIGTVKRRLYLGGLRLAGLLNSIFD